MSLDEPLRFEPAVFRKVWGGTGLAALAGASGPEPDEVPIGEVWQIADRDEHTSVVAEGAFKGRCLSGLMLSERDALLGRSTPTAKGGFPLLIKLLQAARPLSVQVHPDAKIAARIGGGAEPKEECWYILDAEPGSEIHLGLKPDVDAKEFAAAAASSNVVDLLRSFPVSPGEFIHVPPGTVHSIGSGLMLVEVQENSDTTYRLFDWNREGEGRGPRSLQVDLALQSIDYGQVLDGPRTDDLQGDVNRRAELLDSESFAMDLLEIHEPADFDTGGLVWAYVVVDGSGRLCAGEHERQVARGQAWVIPACVGRHRFDSPDGELRVLQIQAKERAS
ncbi:MAG: hypothetical protein GY711_00510 [bacterium]|nr:hypothetical protein [bacterium]